MTSRDFTLRSIMIHDVPRGGSDESELVLTDAALELDTQLTNYFEGKISRSLGLRGVAVIPDAEADSTVTDSVRAILNDESLLATASVTVARTLAAAQTGVNPPGLLCVAVGEFVGRPAISILKLEREQGVRFEIHEQDGKRVVDLQFLRDLTLTEKTKVFKTSVFTAPATDDKALLEGLVSDDQRGMTAGRGVADFFLRTFLGCRLQANPAQATFAFIKSTEEFLNASVRNPEKRGQYQVALLATMQDQQLDVSPRNFVFEHLDPPDQSPLLEHLRESGIEPDLSFEKDLSLVRVNGFRMSFENGMVLVGSSDDLRERVSMRSDDAEVAGVEINDPVSELRGR